MTQRELAAQELFEAWKRQDPEIERVYAFHLNTLDARQPAEFLIVTGSCGPSSHVYPFGFAPSKEVPFATRIAEVNPDDLAAHRLETGFLPDGWDPSKADKVLEGDAR